jgi:hypothetical protein
MRSAVDSGLRVGLVVVSAALVSSAARADTPAPTATPSATTPPLASATRPATPAEPKSENVADALSVSPTLLGLGVAGVGLYIANLDPTCTGDPSVPPYYRTCKDHFPLGLSITIAGGVLVAVGPSLGHIYNGRAWTTGLKVRLVGAGVGALGWAIAALGPSDCDSKGFICPAQAIGILVVFGGAGTFVVGAGIDVVTASSAVRERNSQLTIARLRTPGGSAPALMFNMTF